MGIWQSSQRRCIGERRTVTTPSGREIVCHHLGLGHRLIACASAGRPGSDFNELAENLVEAGFRLLIVEAPGIGGADRPSCPVSLYDLADDLNLVAREDAASTGYDVVTIGLGHGFGNRVVRAAAARHGDVFTASILLGPGGHGPLSTEARIGLDACFSESTPPSARHQHIQASLFAPSNTVPLWWRSGWKPDIAAMQGKATGLTGNGHWKRAGTGAVLIVVGAQDMVAPPGRVCPDLSSLLGDRAEIRIINDAGHALLPEQPIALASAIADFCRRHAAG